MNTSEKCRLHWDYGGLTPPVFFLIAILGMALLHVCIPVSNLIVPEVQFLGILPLMLGLLLNLVADRAFKKARAPVHPNAETTLLLQIGVFAVTRNPMYLGMTLILLGIAMMLGSIVPFVVPLVFILLIRSRFIQPEEQKLRRIFGQEWDNYARRVRRWL
mgnify:CR=1 FL=1